MISPSLTWSHAKYIFKSKYFIGYFFSNSLIGNINYIENKYDFVNEHYVEKTFNILQALNICFNRDNLSYPPLKHTKYKPFKNYIVIAPYTNWKERTIPKTLLNVIIKSIIKDTKHNIVIVGSSKEEEN